jgi:hypothetical protein
MYRRLRASIKVSRSTVRSSAKEIAMQIAFTLDAYNKKAALRWSATQNRFVPFPYHRAVDLIKLGLADYIGWR